MKTALSMAMLALCAAPAHAADAIIVSSVTTQEVAGAVLEVRTWDPATRTIVLRGDSGRDQVLRVDERTLSAVSRLSPGEKLLVSYRFNRNGEAEVILRGMPVGQVPVAQVRAMPASEPSSLRVSVVSSQPEAGTLTIRGEKGDVRTLSVDADLADALKDLRPGDKLLVDIEADSVVGIVRAR